MKENNILLANFLGWKIDTEGRYIAPFGEMDESSYMRYDYEKDNLQFDCDWNWLMEVVEKIESLGLSQRNFTVKISYDVCSIDFTSLYERRETPLIFKRSTDQRNKIEAVYNACVEFVKWLNKEEYQKAVMNSIDLE